MQNHFQTFPTFSTSSEEEQSSVTETSPATIHWTSFKHFKPSTVITEPTTMLPTRELLSTDNPQAILQDAISQETSTELQSSIETSTRRMFQLAEPVESNTEESNVVLDEFDVSAKSLDFEAVKSNELTTLMIKPTTPMMMKVMEKNFDEPKTTLAPEIVDRVLDEFVRRKTSNDTDPTVANLTLKDIQETFPENFNANQTFDYDFEDGEARKTNRKQFVEYYELTQYYWDDSPNITLWEVEGNETETVEVVDESTTTEPNLQISSKNVNEPEALLIETTQNVKDISIEEVSQATTSSQEESTFKFPPENLVTPTNTFERSFKDSGSTKTTSDHPPDNLSFDISTTESFDSTSETSTFTAIETSTHPTTNEIKLTTTTEILEFINQDFEKKFEENVSREKIDQTTTDSSTTIETTTEESFTFENNFNVTDHTTDKISSSQDHQTSTLGSKDFNESSTIETTTDSTNFIESTKHLTTTEEPTDSPLFLERSNTETTEVSTDATTLIESSTEFSTTDASTLSLDLQLRNNLQNHESTVETTDVATTQSTTLAESSTLLTTTEDSNLESELQHRNDDISSSIESTKLTNQMTTINFSGINEESTSDATEKFESTTEELLTTTEHPTATDNLQKDLQQTTENLTSVNDDFQHKEIEYYYVEEDYEVIEGEASQPQHIQKRDNSAEYYVDSISASREFRSVNN